MCIFDLIIYISGLSYAGYENKMSIPYKKISVAEICKKGDCGGWYQCINSDENMAAMERFPDLITENHVGAIKINGIAYYITVSDAALLFKRKDRRPIGDPNLIASKLCGLKSYREEAKDLGHILVVKEDSVSVSYSIE